ncbi:MBL fold metallo-hydrolase [Guggenheimella bovis]
MNKRFRTRLMGVNVYVLSHGKKALVIDPGERIKALDEYLKTEGLEVVAILLTHGHSDHIMGVNEYREEWNCPVYVHENDLELLEDSDKNGALMIFRQSYTVENAETFGEGMLTIDDFKIQVLHTPGHTQGSVCFIIDGELFSGDTLFQSGIGRYDLYGGSESMIFNSIRSKLYTLKNLPVFPGHGPETTIDEERRTNPFVRM